MRWFLSLFGVVLLAGGLAHAQPDGRTRRFETANEAYTEGRYTRAAEIYEGLLDRGAANAALYYNLGNAYVRLDRLGPAIRYYEKARRLRPDDARIRHNLEQARRRAGVYPARTAPRPSVFVSLVRGWSPLALLLAGVLLLSGGLAAVVVRAGPGRSVPLRSPAVWAPVLGGMLLAATALGVSYVQSLDRAAVVVAENAPLHRTPSAEAPPDTTLPEGVLLKVRTRTSQWHEVQLSDGTTGWVPVRALGDV